MGIDPHATGSCVYVGPAMWPWRGKIIRTGAAGRCSWCNGYLAPATRSHAAEGGSNA